MFHVKQGRGGKVREPRARTVFSRSRPEVDASGEDAGGQTTRFAQRRGAGGRSGVPESRRGSTRYENGPPPPCVLGATTFAEYVCAKGGRWGGVVFHDPFMRSGSLELEAPRTGVSRRSVPYPVAGSSAL